MAARIGILATVGLLGGLAGCSSHQGSVSAQPSQEPPRAVSHKEKDEPKKELQASTCVALGQTSQHSADMPGRTPIDQEHLREQARRAYIQALKLEPKNLEALSGIGNLYMSMNDYSRALESFRKATEVAPTKASTWYDLGMCQSRVKDWQPALATLQKAVDLEPENRSIVHAYGYCLARAGKYDASFAVFARVDGEAAAHYNLGRMLVHMKEEGLAREHLQKAAELDTNLVAAGNLLNQISQNQPGQGVTIGAPSPIIPTSYEKVSPAEGAAFPEGMDRGKDGDFSKEAAAALRRVGGNPQ
jgi:Tfp pilus assembly protein PilF